jgi:predicted tellurium resistance membrane protein TerC
LEFVLGATVVLNDFLKETVYLIIFLLVVFIFYIGLHLITSQYSGCGCFSLDNASPKSYLDGIGVIFRDIFLILISANMIGHVKKGGK